MNSGNHLGLVCWVVAVTAGRAALGQDCLGWVGHAGAQAPARVDASAVYDSRRALTVLFGGSRQPENQFLADTWEWDGYSWKRSATTGPSARSHLAMAYDKARGVTVLFGGMTASSPSFVYSGETWEWDGTTWTLRATSGPAAQGYHAMAYDEIRGVTVLYGRAGGVAETWEWNGTSWTNRNTGTPGYRFGHSLYFDASSGKSILFGGRNSVDELGDSWEWDGVAWSVRRQTGPLPRLLHQMVYDSGALAGFLVGGPDFSCTNPEGCPKPKYDDAWRFSAAGWQRLAPLINPRRYSHAMAFDDARSRAVVFSGNTSVVYPNGAIADTWEFSSGAWVQPGASGPGARYSHVMAYDTAHAQTIMFGGFGIPTYRDTWAWDGRVWTSLATTGPSVTDPSLIYDSDRAVLVLLDGGGSNGNPLSATYEWDGQTWVARATGVPAPRRRPCVYYDPVRHATVLVGGRTSQLVPLTDMWQWNGAAWTLISANVPPFGRTDASGFFNATFDETRLVPVLRETYIVSGVWVSATWEWNGSAWVQRLLESPSDPNTSFVLYDSTRHAVVRDTYNASDESGSILEWNGQIWVPRPGSSRRPRTQGGFAYDHARDRIVAFGEVYFSAAPGIGTWEYGSLAPSVEVQPQPATITPGTRVVLSVGVSGSGPIEYQWRKNGAPVPGAVGASLVIPNGGPQDAGAYDVVVTNFCGNETSIAADVLLICPSDFNYDGFVNGNDADGFFNAFFAGELGADFNGDGSVTNDDFDAFTAAFVAGC